MLGHEVKEREGNLRTAKNMKSERGRGTPPPTPKKERKKMRGILYQRTPESSLLLHSFSDGIHPFLLQRNYPLMKDAEEVSLQQFVGCQFISVLLLEYMCFLCLKEMGASASSPASCSNTQPEPMTSSLQAQSKVCTSFSSVNVDQYGKEKKRKVGSLSTLRKRFARRRRTGKGFDHAQVFREFLTDWSPRDVVALVEEYEATAALKDITLQAEMARPPAASCKQDLGLLFENKYCSDINLIYQGTVFAVHRAILAARCPFFREMLNSLSSICTEVAVDIDIAGVSISMFNELLRYLYTGDLSVAESYSGNFDILFQLRKPCKICHGTNEFWCHRAILSARSPFFRNVIHRQQRRSADLHETHRTRILLDDSIIPRRYACILLRAVYQDALEFGAVLPDSAKRGSLTDVHVPQSSVEEAMQLFEVARFIEMDALVQNCEDYIVESLSLENLLPVLRWSSQPHGSQWVYRQAINFIREEFMAVAASPILFQLDKSHLIDVVKSDFLQAGELEVLQAVLKWGEHQLFKRVEEREPNLVSHTAHSVSRRGFRRRDLSDVELRDLLSDLLSCVRISHILPPDSEALVSAVRRGLISTPPSYMLGDDLLVGHSSNLKSKAWIRGRNSHGLYIKPRLFTPYVEEAKAWLEEQLGQDTDVVRQQVWHISHIPDTLYMVEKPLSFNEGILPLGHLCPLSSLEFMKDVVLDEMTLRQMKKREKELRQSQSARRAYSVIRNHCDVTKLLQLRVVREFGLPDKVMEVLHRTSYQFLEEYGAEHHPSSATPGHQSRYAGDHSSHMYGLPRMYKPSRHLSLELGEARDEPLQASNQMSRSCCSDHLNEIIPDIAMATSLLEQIHISESETSPDSGVHPYSNEDKVMTDTWDDVSPIPITQDLPEIKLFGKWNSSDVQVSDISLTDYIAVKEKYARYLPHSAGRFATKRFRKAQCPIVERLTNSMMMHGRNNGKKLMAVRIVKHAFEIIYLMTSENPLQVLVNAIINSGPREDSTRIGRAGTVRRQAVDVSPLRRVNQAIWLLCTGAREAAFRNIKSIAECLADELINAAKGSSNSYAIKKKDELERVAKSNR
ncbi:hypothetical protein CDAR_481791 [Caerostris darwini]|uniref:BTB domain-containing protein n=1 Tax=Caerostris darwini TaxID=1538125 RepID=A0AAV4UXA4_9ARAC|nr:hypothetical protein CDAR_481791 [Caerostris darwini]